MILREIKNIYVPVLQRIEYLESTEDYVQYIDTGVKIDSETAFQGSTIDFQILTLGINDSVIVAGSVLSEGTHSYENTECIVYEEGFYPNGGFDFSQYSDIYVRTTATSNGKAKGISNLNLILFARNVKGLGILRMTNGQRGGTCRIFSCIIRKNGDVIRDFIPVRIGTKGYMLDKVSGELYGNSGTGDFVLGQDVNSGLQQIYQNKLIEGVDYETYDWLVQDENGGAYIDTKIKDLTDFSKIKLHYYVTGNPSRIFGRETINAVGGGQCLILINSDNTRTQLYCPKGYQFKNVDKDQTMYIDFDNQQATLNNETVSVTLDKIVTSQTMKVFTRYPGEAKAGVKFAEVTFTTTNGEILHLVPCTLLHSIPRNLDAQCKERVAGECGMIDLISGKFYGNVASSGTFTVENDNNE